MNHLATEPLVLRLDCEREWGKEVWVTWRWECSQLCVGSCALAVLGMTGEYHTCRSAGGEGGEADVEREALVAQGEQREEQQAKQQAGAAAAEEEGMPELTLKQALVGNVLPVKYRHLVRHNAAVSMRTGCCNNCSGSGSLLAECGACITNSMRDCAPSAAYIGCLSESVQACMWWMRRGAWTSGSCGVRCSWAWALGSPCSTT